MRVAEHEIGLGNPIGGLVFSTAFGQLQQLHEWTVRSPSHCNRNPLN
jgi:hypothetical protein